MNNLNSRLRRLEKRRDSLPTFTQEEIEKWALFIWMHDTSPAGRPPSIPLDETVAGPYFLTLPAAERRRWLDLARYFLQTVTMHPEVVSEILAEMAAEMFVDYTPVSEP